MLLFPQIQSVKKFLSLSLFFIASLSIGIVEGSSSAEKAISIAVASSFYPYMQEQAKAFEKSHHVKIRLVSGSTGRLYNQIMQGAPFDIFIAADEERPALLAQNAKVLAHYHIGKGSVGLITKEGEIRDAEALKSFKIKHIAIANPDIAPFGKVAKAFLNKQGLWDELQQKLIYTQSAMQAKMMVHKGLADAGFVPVTAGFHPIATIDYHALLLTDNPLARLWINALRSRTTKQIAWKNRND